MVKEVNQVLNLMNSPFVFFVVGNEQKLIIPDNFEFIFLK